MQKSPEQVDKEKAGVWFIYFYCTGTSGLRAWVSLQVQDKFFKSENTEMYEMGWVSNICTRGAIGNKQGNKLERLYHHVPT